MKIRELFSPIPKEIFKDDDVRERVEIFLVLFVVAGLGYKFVKGSINSYQSLDDHNIALAVFANAAVVAAFLLAYYTSGPEFYDISYRQATSIREFPNGRTWMGRSILCGNYCVKQPSLV